MHIKVLKIELEKSEEINWNETTLVSILSLMQRFSLSFIVINLLLANVPSFIPWKYQQSFDFEVFSAGIKWEHWPEFDQIRETKRRKKGLN